MFSLFSKQKSAFGLDISETSVRMMQLEPASRGFFPTAYAEAPMPKGIIKEEKIDAPETLAKLIMRARSQPVYGRFRGEHVVLSVPESKSFVRVITVPKMSEKEAREAVPFEAEQYIPVASDQVYLDFKILPETDLASAPNKMKVIICATPRNLIDNYTQVVKLAKLKPVAVEVESEAVARCLVDKKNQNTPTLILDIGAFHTSLIIYDLKTLQFTSSLPIAGNSFTNQISQGLTISLEESEKIKRQIGILPQRDDGRVRATLSPLMNSLMEAVRNTINFYREHSEGARDIKQILLCGSGSKLRGLADYLNERAASESAVAATKIVQLGDPWVNVLEKPITKIPPISKVDSISFTTVIGLALRGAQME